MRFEVLEGLAEFVIRRIGYKPGGYAEFIYLCGL